MLISHFIVSCILCSIQTRPSNNPYVAQLVFFYRNTFPLLQSLSKKPSKHANPFHTDLCRVPDLATSFSSSLSQFSLQEPSGSTIPTCPCLFTCLNFSSTPDKYAGQQSPLTHGLGHLLILPYSAQVCIPLFCVVAY